MHLAFIIVLIFVVLLVLVLLLRTRAMRVGEGISREYMTFPRDEWKDIEHQLDVEGRCGTARVCEEYDRWRAIPIGTVVDSDVGTIRIVSKKELRDAFMDHPYHEEVARHPDWIAQLRGRPGLYIMFKRAT